MSALDKGITRALQGGCPEALGPVIRDFVNAVCEIFSDQNIGVLLVGSASRGELSWHMAEGKTVLFSDIEFLIGVDHHDRARQAKVDHCASQIADAADLGTFFHIDFTFIEWSVLPTLDTKFFIFESKTCGIDLCSYEVAPVLPTTTRANLNWKELNEILIHRLSAIVHAIPKGFIRQDLTASANQSFALALAKNTLDITTWLHPYESTELVAGYKNRVGSWAHTQLEGLALSNYLASADLEYLQSCIALRQAPATSADSRQMLQHTLDMYGKCIGYCKHMNHIADEQPISGFNVSSKLFDEYRIRSRISQSLCVLKNTRAIGFGKLLRNLVGVRRGLAIEICRDLIAAALAWATNEREATQLLTRARQHLQKVNDTPASGAANFPVLWRDTVAVFAQYQQITHNY